MKIELNETAIQRIRKGDPLIHELDLKKKEHSFPLEWVTFVDRSGNAVATGYLGKQNKGIGWVVSQKNEPINAAFYETLFRQAIARRKQVFANTQTTAFRLFNGEGDGLGGLTVDHYDGYLVLSWYNATIYALKEDIIASLQRVFPENLGMVEKIRFATEGKESRWLEGEKPSEPLIVKENGVSYAVYLDEGYMTGIFLDQKDVRGRLTEGLPAGKKVLNMFSYTGAFSVAAAFGGAASTTSVDLAQRSLPKTQEQFAVNGLSLAHQNIVVMDTFEYFRYAKRKNLTFDIIILDPPSFARNKKKTFSATKDYGRLIEDSVEILAEKGTIIASTNAANYPFDKFKTAVEAALAKKQVHYRLTDSYRLPSDFPSVAQLPESNYLKVLFYEVIK